MLHKRGLVVAISGGIDSSVCSALAVRALGPERVFALILPERDSSDDSAARAHRARRASRRAVHDSTTSRPRSRRIGCYKWRDDAVRRALPEYGEGWRMKIVIAGGIEGRINHFNLVARVAGRQAASTSGSTCRTTCRSSPRRTSSSASARRSSTSTPTV